MSAVQNEQASGRAAACEGSGSAGHEPAPVTGAHGSAGGVSAHPHPINKEIKSLLVHGERLLRYLYGPGREAFVRATEGCAVPGKIVLDRFYAALKSAGGLPDERDERQEALI